VIAGLIQQQDVGLRERQLHIHHNKSLSRAMRQHGQDSNWQHAVHARQLCMQLLGQVIMVSSMCSLRHAWA
jgi:hypothetical protein